MNTSTFTTMTSTMVVAAGIMSMTTTTTPTMLSPQSVSTFWRTSAALTVLPKWRNGSRLLKASKALPLLLQQNSLRLTAKNPDRYLDQIRKICTSIESEVLVKEKDPKPKAQSPKTVTHTTASKKKFFSKENVDIICIIIGAVLFVAGEIMEHKGFGTSATLPVFVIAYLALGGVIVVKAAKNISSRTDFLTKTFS